MRIQDAVFSSPLAIGPFAVKGNKGIADRQEYVNGKLTRLEKYFNIYLENHASLMKRMRTKPPVNPSTISQLNSNTFEVLKKFYKGMPNDKMSKNDKTAVETMGHFSEVGERLRRNIDKATRYTTTEKEYKNLKQQIERDYAAFQGQSGSI